MKTRHSLSIVLMLLSATTALAQKPVKPKASWAAIVRDAKLKRFAPKGNLIVESKSFAKLWKVWNRTEKLPKVDFSKDFVFVGVVPGPNRAFGGGRLSDAGELKIFVAGTRRGGPGFGYVLMQFPRAGVKSVNGVALKAGGGSSGGGSYVKVEVRGKLKTGIFAIGGETTGTIITAGNITWELDLGRNAKLLALAKKYNGKTATVHGTLTFKRGVERKSRWIVKVRSIGNLIKRRSTHKGGLPAPKSVEAKIKER